MANESKTARSVMAIGGADRMNFLQGLVSNDLAGLADGLVYAALLTPQGKYLADFFLLDAGEHILLDVASVLAPALAQRLAIYKLRAEVEIERTSLVVSRGLGPPPAGAWPDPRHPALGWRNLSEHKPDTAPVDWDEIRVAHTIPESGIELIPGQSYILEAGFERLHGVDFRKGCYVGQEVTARMKHKGRLRKGLVSVAIEGAAPVGTEILSGDGQPAGRLFTQSAGRAIAYLRFERAQAEMSAGGARLHLVPDDTQIPSS